MQQLAPMTPCARSSFSISGFSMCVMTSSTPRLSSMLNSVPNVCAAVASSPCTALGHTYLASLNAPSEVTLLWRYGVCHAWRIALTQDEQALITHQ